MMIKKLERIYSAVFTEHISQYRQMVVCPDWDNEDHREIILQRPAALFN